MACNFPAILDDAVSLGGAFSNTIIVTDPLTQIDATYRVNQKDAMFAVQARIGVTSSAVPTSLSWATMSIGGVNNQGLRFAAGSAAWPGLVAEDGIFLENSTGYPNFHRGGDGLNVFYPLTGLAGLVSLQAAYNTSGTITTSGLDDLDFRVTAGDDFIIRNAAGTHTVLAGPATTLTTGLLDINCTAIAATNVMAVNVLAENAINNQEFGCCLADVDNTGDLANTEIMYGYAADLTMGGDGPVAPGRALGAGFYARTAAFTGAAAYESAGLLVDSTYDWGVLSESTLRVEVPINTTAVEIDSDPGTFIGSISVACVGTDFRSGFFAGYAGTIATPTALRYFFGADGATFIHSNSADFCLDLHQTGVGHLFQCTDAGGPTVRFRIENDGTTRVFASNASINSVIVLEHAAATEPFINFSGIYAPMAVNGNITDEDLGGPVVGPSNPVWTFSYMVRVEIVDNGGGIPPGDYWIALYS